MKKKTIPDRPTSLSLEIFQQKPDTLYSLDIASHLAGLPRRSILLYCRAGLVRPVFQAPHGMMLFTEETIHTIRRIEYVRTHRTLDLELLKTLFDLQEEVDRLRSELRFLRKH